MPTSRRPTGPNAVRRWRPDVPVGAPAFKSREDEVKQEAEDLENAKHVSLQEAEAMEEEQVANAQQESMQALHAQDLLDAANQE